MFVFALWFEQIALGVGMIAFNTLMWPYCSPMTRLWLPVRSSVPVAPFDRSLTRPLRCPSLLQFAVVAGVRTSNDPALRPAPLTLPSASVFR
jgi:hypothetical protein